MAIIKDRVNEVTKETDWKEKMADEWNEANAEEERQAEIPRKKMADEVSRPSQMTGASGASKMSFNQRVAAEKKKNAENRPEWDASTTGEKKQHTAEDKIASRIAAEVLRDNHKANRSSRRRRLEGGACVHFTRWLPPRPTSARRPTSLGAEMARPRETAHRLAREYFERAGEKIQSRATCARLVAPV